MAKMSFNASNKSADTENFPKLKLEQDESARITLYEEPEVGFVHNLRAPKLLNGVVQYKVVKTKEGEREELDFDFIGNPICLGDFNTLQERGIDPARCPACKAAQEAPDMFAPPKRRFAMHVFQYTTNGTSKPTRNFQGSVKVWAFTDQKFNELIDLMEEAPDGDMSKIDIILGPCENKLFQKFKMIHSNQVKWRESEATMAAFEEIVKENRAKDLEKFLGRSTKKEWLEDDLDKVRSRWKTVHGQSGEAANDGLASVERPTLDAGLANLLDEQPGALTDVSVSVPRKTATSSEAASFDDLLEQLNDE